MDEYLDAQISRRKRGRYDDDRSSNGAGAAMPSTGTVGRTAEDIVVDYNQSFELMQTVIAATISNIAYMRDIFPDHCYEVRAFDFRNADASYDGFMDGTTNVPNFLMRPSDDIVNWKVLLRHSSANVDKLLHWLEVGVADSLRRKYLATAQLSFYQGTEVSSSTLIEAYTLTFTYPEGVAAMQVGVETPGKNIAGEKAVLLSHAKYELRRLVNMMITTVQDFEPLPPERSVCMHLSYNDTCPPSYHPPGFRAPITGGLLIGSKGAHHGSMSTGYHSMHFKVFSRGVECLTEKATQSQLPATHNVDDDLETQSSSTVPGRDDFTTTSTKPALQPKNLYRHLTVSSEGEGNFTQERKQQASLKRMAQSLRNPTHENTQDTRPLHEPSQLMEIGGASRVVQNSPAASYQFIWPVMHQVHQAREKSTNISQNDDNRHQQNPNPANVSCECGVPSVEGSLVRCEICRKFQHSHCYGYLRGITLTSEYLCYTCLLEREQSRLPKIKELCLSRRALYYLRERSCPVLIKDLVKHLNISAKATNDLAGLLEQEGYLTRTPNKTRKGSSRSAKSTVVLVGDDDKLQKVYFNPTTKIADYFETSHNEVSSINTTLLQSGPDPLPYSEPKMMSHSLSLGPASDDGHDSHGLGKAKSCADKSSCTEGTPSPRGGAAKPSPSFQRGPSARNLPRHQQISSLLGVVVRQKRTLESIMDNEARKRFKESSANSPFISRRA